MQEDIYYIDKILKGDHQSFAYLVNKYKAIVFTLSLRYIKNEQLAEEISQDCFMKVFKNLHSFKKESKFSTWLYRIVYNTSISQLRKTKNQELELKEDLTESDFSEESNDSDLSEEDRAERTKMVHKAIEDLAQDEAFIVTLYYLQEIPIQEICEITKLSSSNVKVKLFRARKKLHKLLLNKSVNFAIV